MSIPSSGDIGLEMHPETDQFIRLDAGRGRLEMGTSKDRLTFKRELSDGSCALIPAGTFAPVGRLSRSAGLVLVDASESLQSGSAGWGGSQSSRDAWT